MSHEAQVQPQLNPDYVPAIDEEGNPRQDSLTVVCKDDDENTVTAQPYHQGVAYMAIEAPDGSWLVDPHDWVYGESHDVPNLPGYVVHYWSGSSPEVPDGHYTYEVVPGKCDTSHPPIPPKEEEKNPTPTPEPETSSTTSPPETTSTLPPTTESSDSPTTTGAPVILLESGPGRPEIMIDCRWDDSMSQFRRANGQFMSYEECSETRDTLPETGGSMTLLLLMVAAVVIVIGTLAMWAGHRRKLTRKVGSLFDRSSTPVSTGF